jgi:hypothetical protein
MDKSLLRGIGIGLVLIAVVDVLRSLPFIGGQMSLIAVVVGIVLIVLSFLRR